MLVLPAVLFLEKSQYYYLIVISIRITNILISMILVCRDILFTVIIVYVRELYRITNEHNLIEIILYTNFDILYYFDIFYTS